MIGNNAAGVPQFPPEPVPRIKPKHGYEWYQDNKIVKIRIPIKGITMKKIDIFISDLVLKINITEKKWVRVLDLKHEIDFQGQENNVVYANEVLEIILVKKEEKKHWEDLIEDGLDKEQIKKRRQESFQRRETAYQEHLKQRNDLKIKFDTHATKEQMRLEDENRKVLEVKKTEEKNQAIDKIYDDVDEKGNITQNQEQKTKVKEEIKPQIIWTHKYDDTIFNDEDIFRNEELAVEYDDKPKVREQKKLDLAFTQRMYPGVAAREQHFKEPPLPKVKQQQEKSGDDLENKNPLWLKDRGDEFYKNQDFYSAIMAYNQAYKLDQSMINCIANRCACNIHLYNYEEALMDADMVLSYCNSLKEEEKELAKNQSLRLKTILRKAIATSWKGDVDRSLEILDKSLSEDIFYLKDNQLIQQFEGVQQTIQKRKESILIKKQGDTLFKSAQYEKALEKYFKCLEIDNNETAMGNISLTYLKMGKNQECVEFCNKSIEKVQKFTRFASFNPINKQSVQDSNNFLIKLYIRKAKAQQQLKLLKESFDTIKQAIQINDKNSEAKEIYKEIEKSFAIEEVNHLKAQAAAFMKENKVSEALEIYNECLKKIDSTETIEYLAILLNRCACFLKLEKYEDIITNCLRGLKIIRSYKNRVISWTNQKLTKEEKDKLISFESRFLVRRANAYLKQNLIFNAKSDLEEALKLDPNNEQLKQDILKIDVTINETKK
ncbi:tetratricopeptide repeat protein (macronuclear) [Tetrahymena thermophila SB210]|uniref:Tetratricopeptide repeat protein n=1 Tax=Tetrahymena thermophila (strain SB210) TaxID=312017 RepID=I7MDJ4_TETTS|nr:tetratricopeptide repeat protein [Tetrahymena thermophila SB210]EAR87721.1 tetratricopeptide repeat protein [Tetrahymena thermophila SB210]|eukprot:XP_001007966.1 tetratricopeptide repeat protein [Tetrahymena thermophila SB210]